MRKRISEHMLTANDPKIERHRKGLLHIGKRSTSQRQTAFHEAGHIVASLQFGIPVTEATIVRGQNYLGMVANSPTDYFGENSLLSDVKNSPKAMRYAIMLMAGYEAEKRFCPRADILIAGYLSAKSDNEKVHWLISMGKEAWLRKHAARFVAKHWEAITAIANELYFHKKLTGDQIAFIMEKGECPVTQEFRIAAVG